MTATTADTKSPKLIRTCSVWRALEVIGDTPILLILESIWWGDRKFDQIQARSGQQRALVSNRLKKLLDADILEKRPYSQAPVRYEYVLTEKGLDLYWVSLMLLRWERNWSTAYKHFDTELMHQPCGEAAHPEPYCGHCKEVIHAADVDWEEGPGVGMMAPVYSRRRRQRLRESSVGQQNNSIYTEAAELMGDRWSSLILRSIFSRLRKFDEIMDDSAIASNILSERLSWLTERGIIFSVKYQASPERYEYWLTKKGVDYYPILVMLQRWGDKYYASPEGPPLILLHKKCGKPLDAMVGCSSCQEPLRPNEVEFRLKESASGKYELNRA